VLYAFTSAANNNGSAFAGLSATTPLYNVSLGLAMAFGRFLPIVLVLALTGGLAAQGRTAVTAGTFPTHRPAVRRAARRRDARRRGPHLLPGALAGTAGRRALTTMTAAIGHVPASTSSLLGAGQLRPALAGAVRKLDPRGLVRQPVILVVWVGSVFSTVLAIADPTLFGWLITGWLWLTVLFANLAEAVAEGRGKAPGRHPA
jgi:Potassium-transporting ATPase A subunit